MPIFEEARRPYELLVRWDQAGGVQGAHVQFRTVVTRDGAPMSDTPEAPIPLSLAGAAGFPLADVLSQAQADALIQVADLQAQLAEAEGARDAALARAQAAEARAAEPAP